MIKLKDILNEVKLIPPNRILLKRSTINYIYYFEVNNEIYYVYNFEIENGKVTLNRDLNNLIQFLDSKKIKYEIISSVIIDAKYFILPDKINEVKLVSMNKLPSKIKIDDEEDIDKYPSLKLHIITKEENDNLNEYLEEIDGNDYEYENVIGMTIYDAAKKLDYNSGYLEEWFTTIINGIFPDIITITPYGSNEQ